jgi:antitoxin ParD1/3/4
MSKNTSVELGEEITVFVSSQVQSGRYGSASEVIRAGIRLLQDQETKMAALREALKEGESSGAAVPFDIDQFSKAQLFSLARNKPTKLWLH